MQWLLKPGPQLGEMHIAPHLAMQWTTAAEADTAAGQCPASSHGVGHSTRGVPAPTGDSPRVSSVMRLVALTTQEGRVPPMPGTSFMLTTDKLACAG